MEGFVIPAVMLTLFAIPLGLELFDNDHSHGGYDDDDDAGDTETDGGTDGGTDTSTGGGEDNSDPLQIVNEGAENEYAVMSDNNDGRQVEDGTAGNDILFGGAGNDALTGLDGNDLLDGGSGDDQLKGGAGDDLLITVKAFDTDFTNQELIDAVSANTSGNIEDLSFFSHFDQNASAGMDDSGADRVSGGEGDDTIIFGGGDIVRGGEGADGFIAVGDTLSEDNQAIIRELRGDDQLVLTYTTDPDSDLSAEEQAPKIELQTNEDGSVTVLVDGKGLIVVQDPMDSFTKDDVKLQAV